MDDKILLLTAIETNYNRYITQVKTPFIDDEQKNTILDRLGTVFDGREDVQGKGYIKEPELPIKVLARVSAEKAEKLDGGEVLTIDSFPEKGYHIEIEKSCETPELVSIDLYADEPFDAEKFIKNGRCCRLIAKSCPINVNSLETAMHSINDGTFVDLIKDSRKIGEVIENDKFINNNT